MPKSFLERRFKNPDYDITAHITGIRMPDGMVHWSIDIDGEDDPINAAGILERAIEVLRDE